MNHWTTCHGYASYAVVGVLVLLTRYFHFHIENAPAGHLCWSSSHDWNHRFLHFPHLYISCQQRVSQRENDRSAMNDKSGTSTGESRGSGFGYWKDRWWCRGRVYILKLFKRYYSRCRARLYFQCFFSFWNITKQVFPTSPLMGVFDCLASLDGRGGDPTICSLSWTAL